MSNKLFGIALGTMVIAAGAFVGYKIATDPELRGSICRGAKDALGVTKDNFAGMSEDVAMRTARLTKNPQINQEWVEKQWETVGY